jgi:hypothetical protein
LGKAQVDRFANAVRDPNIPPPRTSLGSLAPTPHHFYVDDGIYVDWFDINRIERSAAASIEAVFILLGPSALDRRQDPISFDKLEEMVIGPINRSGSCHRHSSSHSRHPPGFPSSTSHLPLHRVGLSLKKLHRPGGQNPSGSTWSCEFCRPVAQTSHVPCIPIFGSGTVA